MYLTQTLPFSSLLYSHVVSPKVGTIYSCLVAEDLGFGQF